MTAPTLRPPTMTRQVAVAWLLVAVVWMVLAPTPAWATTPPTDSTEAPASSAPAGSTATSGGATAVGGNRPTVPTWMFVAGGVLILVAAGWMVQANRSRA